MGASTYNPTISSPHCGSNGLDTVEPACNLLSEQKGNHKMPGRPREMITMAERFSRSASGLEFRPPASVSYIRRLRQDSMRIAAPTAGR